MPKKLLIVMMLALGGEDRALQAEDLKNPGFEGEASWAIVKKGENLKPTIIVGDSQEGKKHFTVSLEQNSSTKKGDFAGVVQQLDLSEKDKGISFYVKGQHQAESKKQNYHWLELLLDEEIIWEEPLHGTDTEWRKITLDLSRYLKEAKRKRIGRNKYEDVKTYRITFRLFERSDVRRFSAQGWVDNFKLLKESPADPQNCEKKKSIPRINDLLTYFDDNDVLQPITKPEHFKIKRKQILEGMEQGMGKLYNRPTRTRLEEFNIQVRLTRTRGRYTRKTIDFEVAPGEVVHADLYEPIHNKPGEKWPGIIGTHPFGSMGKGSFEMWPLNTFPQDLAMQGYVVIVPDCPGFGETRPFDAKKNAWGKYDFEADRYESGTINSVFNYMSCIDLLQAHPDVDAEKIGAIGHSLGGHNAMFLAAFDQRVKVAISSCGWTPFAFYATTPTRIKAWGTDTYMPPLKTKYNLDLNTFPFDLHEVAAAIAPRIFVSCSPSGDGVFPGWGPKYAAPYIQKYFKAIGAENNFVFYQPKAGHEFPLEGRRRAYRVMNDTFNHHFHGKLGLLAECKGNTAIPELKKALNDTEPKTRWAAAEMLWYLKDASGLETMKNDFVNFASKDVEHALEIAGLLAQLGDHSGYELSVASALKGEAPGQRWRACIALAHIANLKKVKLESAELDPVAVLKTMASEEKNEGVFFVFLEKMHRILNDPEDMIGIFAIAKQNIHHSKVLPGYNKTVADVYYEVAVRDRDNPKR